MRLGTFFWEAKRQPSFGVRRIKKSSGGVASSGNKLILYFLRIS
jgi:hypothetical protein